MTVREELAAAASTVDGIEISPEYRQLSKPGQGWIELLRTEYPPIHGVLGGEDYWGVFVLMPSDVAAAQRFMDEKRTELVRALMPPTGVRWLIVTQVRPEIISVPDNPGIKTMVVEGHRAAEDV